MDAGIEEFHEYVMQDVLGHLEGITSKKMFGGFGMYQDGHIFAIITGAGELYFKVDETNQADYEARGSEPFVYTGHKNRKPTPMPYWIIPEEIMEDREAITEWVKKSVAISRKGKKKK